MGLLKADEIAELAQQLEQEYAPQRDEDERIAAILQRTHEVTTGNRDPVKKIVTGYAGLIFQQDFSLLTSTPFLRVNSPKPSLDREAEKLEAALAGIWTLSQGLEDVWLQMVADFVWSGRGWSKVYPAPQFWAGDAFRRRKGESDQEYLERIQEMKVEDFPIVWKYVDCRGTWPVFDARGDLDQVVEVREMTARALERAYGYKTNTSSRLKVIDYADDTQTAVVVIDGGPILLRQWEHNLGMVPYVLAQSQPQAPRTSGFRWHGVLFQSKDLLVELDGLISDIRFNIKRATRAQQVFKLNLEERRRAAPEKAGPEVIEYQPLKPIVLNLDEDVRELEPARTNLDAYRLVEIITALFRETAIRSVLLGALRSGQSAVGYNTAAQFAQRQYGPHIRALEKAAVRAGRLFLRAVQALSQEAEPISGELERIPILYTGPRGNTYRLEIGAQDVKGWERTIQARIDLAIPVNELADLQAARIATDPSNPLLSRSHAMARWLHVENPEEERDRILQDQVEQALIKPLQQLMLQEGLQILSEPEGDVAEISQRLAGLPPAVQQAIRAHAERLGQPLPEVPNMKRAAGNVGRIGSPQAMPNVPNLRPEPSE